MVQSLTEANFRNKHPFIFLKIIMQVVGKSVNTISGYGGDGKLIKNIGLFKNSQSTFVQV